MLYNFFNSGVGKKWKGGIIYFYIQTPVINIMYIKSVKTPPIIMINKFKNIIQTLIFHYIFLFTHIFIFTFNHIVFEKLSFNYSFIYIL